MKKVLFSCLMFIAICGNVCSQDNRVSWKAHAGVNWGRLTTQATSFKMGYQIGVDMEYRFSDRWSVQQGLQLIVKKQGNLLGNSHVPAYLEVPVSVAYRLPLKDDWQLVVNAGGYMAGYISGRKGWDSYNGVVNPEGLYERTLDMGVWAAWLSRKGDIVWDSFTREAFIL